MENTSEKFNTFTLFWMMLKSLGLWAEYEKHLKVCTDGKCKRPCAEHLNKLKRARALRNTVLKAVKK